MSDTITNADLANMLERYKRALDSVGIQLREGERLVLSTGSKTYGIAFRLNVTGARGACILTDENIGTEDDCTTHGHEGSTGHGRPPVGDDFLGMTKREAFQTLATTCRAMEDIAYATKHQS